MDSFKLGMDWLTSCLSNYQENQKLLQQQRELNQLHSQCNYAQLHLQSALGNILKTTPISPELCSIKFPEDLLICGYEIKSNETVYSFAWIKNNCDFTFSVPACDRLRKKINSAIRTTILRYNAIFTFLDEYQKIEFIKNNRALYNGFHVSDVIDDVDSIILKVAFD